MNTTVIWIIAIAAFTALFLIVGFIGNKVVDKTSDHFRNKAAREKKEAGEVKSESLADRYKKQ
jgi:type VI protein secretion system component VasK